MEERSIRTLRELIALLLVSRSHIVTACKPGLSAPLGLAHPCVFIAALFNRSRLRLCRELGSQHIRLASSGGGKASMPSALEIGPCTLEGLYPSRPHCLEWYGDLRHRLYGHTVHLKWLES